MFSNDDSLVFFAPQDGKVNHHEIIYIYIVIKLYIVTMKWYIIYSHPQIIRDLPNIPSLGMTMFLI